MKRYEKYKPSGIEWIGEVPETWHISKMKYIAQYINGYAFKPADWTDVGLPIIRIQDLTGTNDHPNYFDGQIPKKYLIQNGDILISWAATLDSFVWNRGDAWLNQHIFKTIVNEQEVERNYFVWLSKVAMSNMNNENKHGIMMEHVTSDIFDNYCIPIPPLSEQKSIAAYLDARCGDIDKVVATQEKRIALLNEMKQSIITQAVTQGLNPDAKMKDSGVEWIGMVPEHWEVCRLKNTLKENLMYGANESAECDNPDFPRYIRITDLTDDGKLRDETFKSLEPEKAKPYMLKQGDLLFARSGATVGKTFLFDLDIEACFAGYLIKASFNRTALPKYVFYYTQSGIYENWKNSIFIQATIQNIGAEKYANLPFIRPGIDEQKDIVEYLEGRCGEIDKQIEAVTRQIELLREYKQSLITDVVTGKRKVC